MGKWAFNCRFLAVLVVSALSSLVPLEQSQAQLFIEVYPNQDNPTSQTLWIFGSSLYVAGSSNTADTTVRGSSIRRSQNFRIRDSWQIRQGFGLNGNNLYNANKPQPLYNRRRQLVICKAVVCGL